MHIPLPIAVSPQTLGIVVLALFVVIILLRLIFRRGRRRRQTVPRTRRRGPIFKGKGTARKRDHGGEVARKHGVARSPEWGRVEREHLLHEPACVACGYQGQGLQVHHIKPFHLHPDLELDPRNLITLCEVKGRDHHLLIGHLDDWESYNVHVRDDVRRFHGKSATQIRSDPSWLKEVARRPI